MRIKLKITAILSVLLFAMLPLTNTLADAMTFEMSIPAFGLYCENENAVLHGNVKYVIDENGKAVQYCNYSVNGGTFYVPFICSAFNIPELNTDFDAEICYGEPVRYGNSYVYDFYSSDIDRLQGTVYTLKAESQHFTVDFTMLENQSCICRFTHSFRMAQDAKYLQITIDDAQTDIEYEVLILNGDCAEFTATAEVKKETVAVKDYIDGYFNDLKDVYPSGGDIKPDMLYAIANGALAKGRNYEFFDFFIDSVKKTRLNAYKIEVQSPCTISYSMPADVQKNNKFTPEIYKTDVISTGNYSIDYTVELNGALPYVIESSAEIKKQDGYSFTADGVTDDFYFVFSSSEKPVSNLTDNGKMEPWRIALLVIAGVALCVGIVTSAIMLISYIKNKRHKRNE